MLKQIAIAAAAVAALGAAVSTAEAKLATNGTQLTGIALGSASTGSVSSVILPSGKTVDLR